MSKEIELSSKKVPPQFSILTLMLIWISNVILPVIVQLLIIWILPNSTQDLFVEENRWIQLTIQFFSSAVVLLIIFFLFKSKSQKFLQGMGLDPSKPEWKKILVGLGLGILLISLREIVSFLVRFVSVYYDPTNFIVIFLYSLLFALITSLYEEVFYRGFLQNQVNARLPPLLSILLVSFASFIGTISFVSPSFIYAAFTTSLVFGYLYHIFNNLYLNIGWRFAYVLIPTFGTLLLNYTPFNPSYVNRLQNVLNVMVLIGLVVYQTRRKKREKTRMKKN